MSPMSEKTWKIACGTEKFKQMMDSEAFKALFMGLEKEIADQRIRVMSVGKTAETAEQIGLEMRYAQGFMDGLLRLKTLPNDILEYLYGRVEEEKGRDEKGANN